MEQDHGAFSEEDLFFDDFSFINDYRIYGNGSPVYGPTTISLIFFLYRCVNRDLLKTSCSAYFLERFDG